MIVVRILGGLLKGKHVVVWWPRLPRRHLVAGSRAQRDTVLVIMRWEGRSDLVVIWWWAGSRARLHTVLIVIWWCIVGEAW